MLEVGYQSSSFFNLSLFILAKASATSTPPFLLVKIVEVGERKGLLIELLQDFRKMRLKIYLNFYIVVECSVLSFNNIQVDFVKTLNIHSLPKF